MLLSLVTTEYFISCDDDFIFHNETRIENFLEIITKTGFDIIGGGARVLDVSRLKINLSFFCLT